MIKPHRQHPLWIAFIVHRLSGLVLAVFLPVHFYVLSLAMSPSNQLDDLLIWAEHPLVKFSEIGLVALLALHLFGGLRVMALELLAWQAYQKTIVASTLAAAFFIALLFLLRVFS